jgi:hypothetical protein
MRGKTNAADIFVQSLALCGLALMPQAYFSPVSQA